MKNLQNSFILCGANLLSTSGSRIEPLDMVRLESITESWLQTTIHHWKYFITCKERQSDFLSLQACYGPTERVVCYHWNDTVSEAM